LGTTIGGIDEVELCLNSLILTNPLETKESLINKIKLHYTRCLTMEFYKIIGGLDLIGNPIGLFSDVDNGISNFFYEPAQAIFLVQSPKEVAYGIGRGTQSLLNQTLHGTFGGVSKVTKSVQKGLNFLTFDEDFIKEKEQKSTKKSYGLSEGFSHGSKELLDGFSEGIGGLLWKPITGAQEEGAFGFIKGVGKGIVGAPVKSVSGVVNFLSKTSEGISNTGRQTLTRIRYPRTFRDDGLLIVIQIPLLTFSTAFQLSRSAS
jgi:vacuolar protein sorting-associated protein 13A/C